MGTHQKQRAAKIVARGEGFAARVTDARDGKRKWIHGATREEVEQNIARMARVRSDQALGLVNDTERRRLADRALHGPLTVRRAWEQRMATRPESNTAEHHAATLFELLPGGSACLCEDLHGGTIGEWWRAARERYAHATVQSSYYQLRRALSLLVERGLLSRIPWDGEFRPPRAVRPKPRILRTESEIRALIGAAVAYDDRQIRHHRYLGRAAFIVTALATCARHAELVALGWDHVWIEGEQGARVVIDRQGPRGWKEKQARWKKGRAPDAVIRATGEETAKPRPMLPTKNGRSRTILLAPLAVAVLRLHRDQLRAIGHFCHDGPVFPNEHGGWYANGIVIPPHQLAAFCRVAGVPEVTIHQLRHTGLSHSMAANPDAANTAAFSGHSDLRTLLERYTHATGAAGLVPSVPLSGVLPQPLEPIQPRPRALPPRAKQGDNDDRRPDFAAVWERVRRDRARGIKALARPVEITEWAARRGQRAARAAKARGRDENAARRAAQRIARGEWDRWLAWQFAEPETPEVLALPASGTQEDIPEDAPAPAPRPRVELPDLTFPPEDAEWMQAVQDELDLDEMCARLEREEEALAPAPAPPPAPRPRVELPDLVFPEPKTSPDRSRRAAPPTVLHVVPRETAIAAPTRAAPKKATWAQRAAEVWREALADLGRAGVAWTLVDERAALARAAPRYRVDPGEVETWGHARRITAGTEDQRRAVAPP